MTTLAAAVGSVSAEGWASDVYEMTQDYIQEDYDVNKASSSK